MLEMLDLEQEMAIGVVSPSARFDRVIMCGSRRNHKFSMGSMLAMMLPTCIVFLLGGVAKELAHKSQFTRDGEQIPRWRSAWAGIGVVSFKGAQR